MISQLTQQTTLSGAERFAEDVIPRIPHQLEQRRGVPIPDWSLRIQPRFAHETGCFGPGAILVGALEFAIDERPKPTFVQLHPLADTFVIGGRHVSPLRSVEAAWAARSPRRARAE